MKLVVAIGLQPDGGRAPRCGAKVPGRVRDSVTFQRFTKDMAGRAPLEREGAGLESQGNSPRRAPLPPHVIGCRRRPAKPHSSGASSPARVKIIRRGRNG